PMYIVWVEKEELLYHCFDYYTLDNLVKKVFKKYLSSFIPLAYNAIMKSIMLKEEYIMLQSIHKNIDHLYDEMVDIRRYLHQHPELSFEETETSKYISHFYEELGIPYKSNIGGNGVIATLKGGKPGKTIALRADFDALPIQE